ncbi:hypothetical protein Tco_1387356 [Tanacetum coccineum]
MMVQNQSQMGEGLAILTDPHHTPTFIQPSPQPQKTQKPRKPKRKNTQIPQSSDPSNNVADEAVHKELGDSLVRGATIASNLEEEQDSGGGPRCQETIGDTIAQTRFENVSKHSNDSLLARGNTLRSDEDRLKLKELMALSRVESSDDEESLGEDASKQGRIDAIDADEEITLVSVVSDKVSTASVATTASAATTTTATITTIDNITLAQALEEMKNTKPKKKGIDKGKGILIEPVKKKDQILLDEETTLNLQAEFDEEERIAREKAKKEQEANIALIETWDDIQAKIDADLQLAERLQAQEQEELSVEEKATLFQ